MHTEIAGDTDLGVEFVIFVQKTLTILTTKTGICYVATSPTGAKYALGAKPAFAINTKGGFPSQLSVRAISRCCPLSQTSTLLNSQSLGETRYMIAAIS